MLFHNLAAAALGPACSLHNFSFCNDSLPSLLDASLDELKAGLDARRFTSVDLVTAYLARIHEVNPVLHAVLETNPEALSIAAELDRTRSSSSSPLHGIPILVKDTIATADKLNTTAGSHALLGAVVSEDSTVIAKLRKAGAIVLGKSNLSQWSGLRGSNATDGWSARGGQTTGAYFEGMDPSGSSSGSAVGASAGLAWAALGVDARGSLVNPAHKNNVVGIRPSLGLTSRHLVIPASGGSDTVGPLARTVKDAAYLLQAIAGADAHDAATGASPFGYNVPDYVAACRDDGLKGKRIGVPKGMMQWWLEKSSVHALAAMDKALETLKAAGAVVVEDVELHGARKLTQENKSTKLASAHGMATGMSAYLEQLQSNPNNIRSMDDIRKFTRSDDTEEYPHVDTRVLDDALDSDVDPKQREKDEKRLRHLAGEMSIAGALREYRLDAIVMPTAYASFLASAIGYPVVSVPLGRTPDWTPVVTNDLGTLNVTAPNQPFGLAFTGQQWTDQALIGMAYAFEQRTLARQQIAPYVQAKTELKDVLSGEAMEL